MVGALLKSRNRKEVADPFNWVTRAKIQSAMDEQYHRCKQAIEQHLKAYYGERQASVFARAGVTGRATVELFESEAAGLVVALAECVKALSRNPRAFQMIVETTNGFVSYLDLVVGRIGPRIDLEMRNFPKSENLPQATGDMWRESRLRILEALYRHREDFGLEADEHLPEPLEIEEVMQAEEEEQAAPVLEPEDPVPAPQFDLLVAAQAMFERPTLTDVPEVDGEEEFQPPILDLDIELEVEEQVIEPVGDASPSMAQWHEMWSEIAVQLCTGKLAPENRSQVCRAMSDWFAASGMDGLDAELDNCARTFWKKFAPPLRITTSLGRRADASRFDRLAWQSDSPRGAGLATGEQALPRQADVRCSVSTLSLDLAPFGDVEVELADEEPDASGIRYHVSWSMRPDSPIPAPFIDIG